jgi:TonB family protein
MMMRSLAVLLAVALLAASPSPSASPLSVAKPTPAASAGDRVAELAGSWTCRNPFGSLSAVAYRAERGGVAATETSTAGAVTATEVFTPIPSGGWTVERTAKYGSFSGYAPAWTSGTWVITESQKHGAEIRYERIDDRTLIRTFRISGHPPLTGEVCARGGAPPDPALCAVPDVPASVVKAMMPDTPLAAQQNHVSATVEVLVSLDAEGRVTGATIQRSGLPVLNDASLAAARGSTYRAALHDCKPVPSTYSFKADFNAQ